MKFKIGQVVRHKLFKYKGVIFGTDRAFGGTDTWYDQVAKTRPPKNKPWYRVLVHGSAHTTYVAERNLEIEENAIAIDHPLMPLLFDELVDSKYIRTSSWDGDVALIPSTIAIA
ncbi:MAG: heat shock protein HspQ [Candidatus Marinimicrobia bacterium]|nr:heat shock protein HspQ [Candidatus Neomarinimicrobiota bacterium]